MKFYSRLLHRVLCYAIKELLVSKVVGINDGQLSAIDASAAGRNITHTGHLCPCVIAAYCSTQVHAQYAMAMTTGAGKLIRLLYSTKTPLNAECSMQVAQCCRI